MKGRFSKVVRIVLASGLIGLTAAPAGAQLKGTILHFYLDGVDSRGNLTHDGGAGFSFVPLINTRSGTFIGTAHGEVENQSHLPQVYLNGYKGDGYITVTSSLYAIDASGDAFLILQGRTNRT